MNASQLATHATYPIQSRPKPSSATCYKPVDRVYKQLATGPILGQPPAPVLACFSWAWPTACLPDRRVALLLLSL